MQKIIISDTSCLILLHKIGELEILHKLFGAVVTTQEVADEFGIPLPSWIELQQPSNTKYQSIIEASVDKGEASAIALAIEHENSLLIIDELKGRKLAHHLALNITGTVGILVEAKIVGLIPSVSTLLMKIKQTNFRISHELELIVLKKAGEV